MRLLVALSIAAALAAPAPQQAPNFAGKWSEQTPSATAGRGGGGRSGDMGSGWGNPITITQNGQKLTVEYAFFGRGDMQAPLVFVYSLDGKETVNTVMMGRGMEKTKSITAWSGSSLIITTLHDFADPTTGKTIPVEVKRVLTLRSADTLAIETTRAGVLGAQPVVTRTTLVRAAQ